MAGSESASSLIDAKALPTEGKPTKVNKTKPKPAHDSRANVTTSSKLLKIEASKKEVEQDDSDVCTP